MKSQILPFLAGCLLITTIAATSPKVQETLSFKPVQPKLVVSQTFEKVSLNTINNFLLSKIREGYVLKSNSLVSQMRGGYSIEYSAIVTLEKY
jgi:hypothetical protein